MSIHYADYGYAGTLAPTLGTGSSVPNYAPLQSVRDRNASGGNGCNFDGHHADVEGGLTIWQKNAGMTKMLFNFGETLQQNRTDIKERQRESRQPSTAVQLLAREMQQIRENETHEGEKWPCVWKTPY